MTPGQPFRSLHTCSTSRAETIWCQTAKSCKEECISQKRVQEIPFSPSQTSFWKISDVALIEAFSIFDPAKISENFAVQDAASHGVDALTCLRDYYGPHTVVN